MDRIVFFTVCLAKRPFWDSFVVTFSGVLKFLSMSVLGVYDVFSFKRKVRSPSWLFVELREDSLFVQRLL